MREIRMLRAMWRVLETEPRTFLNGHAGGNAGYSQGVSYGSPRQRSTLPRVYSAETRFTQSDPLDGLRPLCPMTTDLSAILHPLS